MLNTKIMLLNLSRSFHFDRDQKEYDVDYLFTKEKPTNGDSEGISLQLNISVNNEKKRPHQVNKSTSTLYQSNEVIEKMIEEETVSFCNQ